MDQKPDANSYRALCLPTVIMKLYSRILDKRLRKEIEDNLEEEESTFRTIRQMQDHMCTMRSATDKLLSRGRDMYMVILDLKSGIWYSTLGTPVESTKRQGNI